MQNKKLDNIYVVWDEENNVKVGEQEMVDVTADYPSYIKKGNALTVLLDNCCSNPADNEKQVMMDVTLHCVLVRFILTPLEDEGYVIRKVYQTDY